ADDHGQARILAFLDAHRRAQGGVRRGLLTAEAFDRSVAVEAYGRGVSAYVADGEGAGGKLVEPHLLERRKITAPNSRGVRQLLQVEAAKFSSGLQRSANIGACLQDGRQRI